MRTPRWPDQLSSVVRVGGSCIHLDLFSSIYCERSGGPADEVISVKRKYVIVGVIGTVAVLLFAALLYLYAGSQVPSGQAPLRKLTAENVDDLKAEFNAAKDKVRVLLLLSPT